MGKWTGRQLLKRCQTAMRRRRTSSGIADKRADKAGRVGATATTGVDDDDDDDDDADDEDEDEADEASPTVFGCKSAGRTSVDLIRKQ
jgi:Ran GTPase-activating protein (RanGAP) involved in mRNA processing and transport